ELRLEQAFQPAPVRPHYRPGDRMRNARERTDAPASKHLLLRADVEDTLEVDETANEVRYAPYRLAVNEGHLAGAGADSVHGDVGGGVRAAEHHDPAPLRQRRIVIGGRMHDPAALRLEGVFARQVQGLRLGELSGADGNKVELLAAGPVRRCQFQRPARLAVG